MPTIFSKNCIFTGELDSYCLVCRFHLPTEDDVLVHIQCSKHKTNLKDAGYLDKFKHNCIRKVNGVYYCDICNKTFPVVTKVAIHITEKMHLDGEKRQLLERAGESIIFHGKIIPEIMWNGVVEDTCVVCNAEVENYSNHKQERNHILNLIRNPVTISSNNIYRKIDDTHHCLTCFKIVPDNLMTDHLNSPEHTASLNKLEPHVEGSNGGMANKVTSDKAEDGTKVSLQNNEAKPLKDIKSNTTVKKSSTKSNKIKNGDKPACSKPIPKHVENATEKYGLSVNKDNNTVFCIICRSQITATVNDIREHVTGDKHKKNLPKYSGVNKETPRKMPLHRFITEVSMAETPNGLFIIINNKFYLNALIFCGFSEILNKVMCQACHIDMEPTIVLSHILSSEHCQVLEQSYIITSLDYEFIREFKSNLYHCGYCGTVKYDWTDMLEHVKTAEHKKCRDENEKEYCLYKNKVAQDNSHNRQQNTSGAFNFADMFKHLRQF